MQNKNALQMQGIVSFCKNRKIEIRVNGFQVTIRWLMAENC